MSEASIPKLIEELSHRVSTKRRSIAKKLRILKRKEAGPALLIALKNEINDKRTWETQYQIIMALSESGYTESLDFLLKLSEQEFEATMIYIAIGDAISRLTYLKYGSIKRVIFLLNSKKNTPFLIDGLIRAIAILRLVPPEEEIEQIVSYGNSLYASDNSRAWIASAAAGWKGKKVEEFLNQCVLLGNPNTKKAAEAALNKKYLKWDIL